MAEQIRFDDGAAYEDFMGKWSRLAGDTFLDWLAPPTGLRWLDVGCGNGASTAMLVERCAPREVQGIDPSAAQLDFARLRLRHAGVRFHLGDAVPLPFADASFDAAVMALVLFFVPEPAPAIAEMARVVAPGGSVSAYLWDFHGGGFPFAALQEEMAAIGLPPIWPPSVDASRVAAMEALWTEAGLVDVATHAIRVTRTFDDFERFWAIACTGPRLVPRLGTRSPADIERLKARVRERLPAAADGTMTCAAIANAVKGTVAR